MLPRESVHGRAGAIVEHSFAMRALRSATVAWLAVATLPACLGVIGDAPSDTLPGGAVDVADPIVSTDACAASHELGPGQLRRLTRFEYQNTLRDLLGFDPPMDAAFPEEKKVDGLDNNTEALTMSPLLVEQLETSAEALAGALNEGRSWAACADEGRTCAFTGAHLVRYGSETQYVEKMLVGGTPCTNTVFGDPAAGVSKRCWLSDVASPNVKRLLPCDPAATGESACAEQFVREFGLRAFRRPLDPGEVQRYLALYSEARASYDFATGIVWLVTAFVQSPGFLYRLEYDAEHGGAAATLDDFTVASRLSYFIWGSMPDDALFAAASSGVLRSAEGVELEARRMLADERADAAVQHFFAQVLRLSRLEHIERSSAVFPEFTPELRQLWQRQAELFIREVFWREPNGVSAFVTAPYSFMNRRLAEFHGIEPAPPGDAFERVALPPGQRAGALALGGVLAAHATYDDTDPIHRGLFVLESLLCETPPPPKNVEATLADLDPGLSRREGLERLTSPAYCTSCHIAINPLGFGLEAFDGVGRYRQRDREGRPINASGQVAGLADVADTTFADLEGMVNVIRRSERLGACFTRQMFRYAMGRSESRADRCELHQAYSYLAGSNYDLSELMIGVSRLDGFRAALQGGAQQ